MQSEAAGEMKRANDLSVPLTTISSDQLVARNNNNQGKTTSDNPNFTTDSLNNNNQQQQQQAKQPRVIPVQHENVSSTTVHDNNQWPPFGVSILPTTNNNGAALKGGNPSTEPVLIPVRHLSNPSKNFSSSSPIFSVRLKPSEQQQQQTATPPSDQFTASMAAPPPPPPSGTFTTGGPPPSGQFAACGSEAPSRGGFDVDFVAPQHHDEINAATSSGEEVEIPIQTKPSQQQEQEQQKQEQQEVIPLPYSSIEDDSNASVVSMEIESPKKRVRTESKGCQTEGCVIVTNDPPTDNTVYMTYAPTPPPPPPMTPPPQDVGNKQELASPKVIVETPDSPGSLIADLSAASCGEKDGVSMEEVFDDDTGVAAPQMAGKPAQVEAATLPPAAPATKTKCFINLQQPPRSRTSSVGSSSGADVTTQQQQQDGDVTKADEQNYPSQQYHQQQPQPQMQYQPHQQQHYHQQHHQQPQPQQQTRSIPIQVMHDSNPNSRSSTPTQGRAGNRQVPVHYSAPPTTNKQPPQQQQQQPQQNRNPNLDIRVEKALGEIDRILSDLPNLERAAAEFQGSKTDKTYLKMEDSLTKKLLKLDTISASDAPGADTVRTHRKSAVKRVQEVINSLEAKAE